MKFIRVTPLALPFGSGCSSARTAFKSIRLSNFVGCKWVKL